MYCTESGAADIRGNRPAKKKLIVVFGNMTSRNETRRDRSRSRDRKNEVSAVDDKPRRRKQRIGWGDPNDITIIDGVGGIDQQQLFQQQQVLALQQQMGNRKNREIYCGNLSAGQVTMTNLREHFNQMFNLLPEFNQKYDFLRTTGAGCVQDVKISTCGTYSFVTFFTEEIAVTALEMDKHDFFGRSMRVGRPTGVVVTTPPPAMDITPLRNQGFLPLRSGMMSGGSSEKKQRELYVGNLHPSVMNPEMIRELFEPACRLIPTDGGMNRPPIISVEIGPDNRFAFVEFMNEELASIALLVFNQVELLDKRISVMRPQGYVLPRPL